MIDLSRGLRHLAWVDDRLFTALAGLPDDAFAVSYAPGAWSVGQLATHIVGSAEWYRYCLTGERWTDLVPVASGEEVVVQRRHLLELDATLLAQAELPDEPMTFEDETGTSMATRSTLLTQAIVHAAEHRAQICCALEAHGFASPSLDDLDLWAFAAWEREQG